ncbi:NAD(P)-dependent dehydrogenase (short-subunit alcohol dehydrogenase family) [Murinocardiopsis flavida]|uniref:NAD(P)-dependent dehydrogenase (Short-subunit alcohol dehydrogenase family) n=1 Tax=Murinocardiopsis flavida TaxID=645275 RepID=A0A2P8DNM8_9ACTN|nr:short chain dehydrogenase [Murinocardiopsis flavida]PSK98809.1 NAD(P)-dependent dehydrogenase (short-subunit alcohol dehydrogenase family) [Murinocardiopsis flavida]
MRILLVGAAGKLGAAVHETLVNRGHSIVTVGRSSGDLRLDITDPAQITAAYDRAGDIDAVASAAGDVPYKPVVEMMPADYLSAFNGKVAGQLELVRQGTARIAERGSFTLITGVLAEQPIPTGSAAGMANGAVEAFVRSAAIEIAPQRVNAVSPTIFTESVADYGDFFPGVEPVDLERVASAYVRSIEGAQTGQVYPVR